jgi:DNA-binding MarR family transcriptional regulator
MVKRRRDTDDRRRVWVEVVPAAYKRLLHAQQPLIDEMKEVTQRFKAEELAIVRDYMREAKEVFQRQMAGSPPFQGRPHRDRSRPHRDP